MKNDRANALTLGLGAVGAVLTMALHPTGGLYGLEGERLLRGARVAAWVHGLGVLSIGAQLCGAWGVVERLGRSAWGARAGLVAFFFAGLMGSIAATISGLSAPHIAEHLVDVEPALRDARRATLFPLHSLVAAFTDVFIVGMAVTPLLWSRTLLSHSRAVGATGAALGVLGIVAFFGGVLVDEVHPLGVFVTAFAVWLLAVAAWLWRTGE